MLLHVTKRLCDCCYVVREWRGDPKHLNYIWACPTEACGNHAGFGGKLPDWYATERACADCYRITYRRKPDRGTDLWGCDLAGCPNHRATIEIMNCDTCGHPHFKEIKSAGTSNDQFDLEIHSGIREFATELMMAMRSISFKFLEGRYRVTVERVKPLIRMADLSDVE